MADSFDSVMPPGRGAGGKRGDLTDPLSRARRAVEDFSAMYAPMVERRPHQPPGFDVEEAQAFFAEQGFRLSSHYMVMSHGGLEEGALCVIDTLDGPQSELGWVLLHFGPTDNPPDEAPLPPAQLLRTIAQ